MSEYKCPHGCLVCIDPDHGTSIINPPQVSDSNAESKENALNSIHDKGDDSQFMKRESGEEARKK